MRVIGARATWAACLATALLFASHPASAEDEWLTNSSLIQPESEQGPFERYDYVNPDAPKGGTLNSVALGTYDSFNPFIVRGTQAAGLNYFGGLLWDTLMQQSLTEPSTSYPLIAEAFKHPEDNSSATYRINPKARWHDGTPITAEDVIWSLNMLKKHSPQHTRYFSSVVEAVALSEREVEFRFDQKGNKELPHIMGDLPVLPKHWWEGTDADGKKRNFTQPTLEPPLGSGPYRIESFTPGSEIVWKRVEDYWAADLPVNVGRYNVDRRKYTYIQDENAAWLAFTKGGLQDIRVETRSRRWATEYTVPGRERWRCHQEGVSDRRRRAHAGLRAEHPPTQVSGPPHPRGADPCLQLRRHEPYAVFRQLYPHGQLFRRDGAGRHRPAGGA